MSRRVGKNARKLRNKGVFQLTVYQPSRVPFGMLKIVSIWALVSGSRRFGQHWDGGRSGERQELARASHHHRRRRHITSAESREGTRSLCRTVAHRVAPVGRVEAQLRRERGPPTNGVNSDVRS